MVMRRRRLAVAGIVVFACVVAACGSSSAAPGLSVAALGDSVPPGTNCDCRPYPSLTADGLTGDTGRTVTASNEAVAGYSTAAVLHQVQSDDSVVDHVRSADVVEIEVGTNDVGYSSSCGTAVDCYEPDVPTIEKNLTSI